MRRTFTALVLLAVAPGLLAGPMDLPDIGSPSDAVLSQNREAQLGRLVMRQLREAGKIVDDPETAEYIDALGHRLAGHAHDGEFEFTFFVVDDPAINAFALPGGYIGVHTGLIQATATESELAGVLAHEIAHVTQRHISRSIYNSQRQSLLTAAAMLAAVVLGAAAGGDVAQGAIALGQSAAIENQIAFTRANESEADRVGIAILASAGFDPEGMPRFFGYMSRRYGLATSRVPQFLMTHPVSSLRLAETTERARQLPPPAEPVVDTVGYGLIKARLRVLSAETPQAALAYFDAGDDPDLPPEAERYGRALAAMRVSRLDEAARSFRALLEEQPEVIAFHTGYAEALAAAGQRELALEVFAEAMKLFPRNVPLTIRYSETLLAAGFADEAHDVLLDLLNSVPPTPAQVRLIALAASAAGDRAEAHYYMGEYHLMNGQIGLAVNQLRTALSRTELDDVQRARFEARLQFIYDNVPEELRRELEQQAGG